MRECTQKQPGGMLVGLGEYGSRHICVAGLLFCLLCVFSYVEDLLLRYYHFPIIRPLDSCNYSARLVVEIQTAADRYRTRRHLFKSYGHACGLWSCRSSSTKSSF